MKITKVKTKKYGLLDCVIEYYKEGCIITSCECTEYDSNQEIAMNFYNNTVIYEVQELITKDLNKHTGKSKIDLTKTIWINLRIFEKHGNNTVT